MVKEKDKFVALMQQEQSEFDLKFAEVATKCSSIVQYQEIEQFEEVAAQAKAIQARLDDCVKQSKVYNSREGLTGNDETNYENIHQQVKEFEPYYSLWTTTEEWRISHHSWLNDDFEKLDAAKLEEIVENSEKTMNKVVR